MDWADFDREKLVLVDFGRKKWVWSILTGKTGSGRFWLGKIVWVDKLNLC